MGKLRLGERRARAQSHRKVVTSPVTAHLPDLSCKTSKPACPLCTHQGSPNPWKRTLCQCRGKLENGTRQEVRGGGAVNLSRNSLATLRANCSAPENGVNPTKGLAGSPTSKALAWQNTARAAGRAVLREPVAEEAPWRGRAAARKGWHQGPHQHQVHPPGCLLQAGTMAWSSSSGRVCPFIPLRPPWLLWGLSGPGVGDRHLPAWFPPKRGRGQSLSSTLSLSRVRPEVSPAINFLLAPTPTPRVLSTLRSEAGPLLP